MAAVHPLRAARLRERFSLRQLAKVVDLNFRRISAIERGAQPTEAERRLLCAALRLSPADLCLDEKGASHASW